MAAASFTTANQPKLKLSTKIAYGTGDLGPAMVSMIKGFFLLNFLTNVAGLTFASAGSVLLLAKIWDAVNDPLVGTLTDRTRSRWGRRRPWLLIGALPFALAFVMHFYVPDISVGAKFWYYVLMAVLLDAGFSVVNVPYAAMTPELTQDEQERTDLNKYRFSFSVLGGLVAAVMYNTVVSGVFADNPQLGNVVQALIVGAVIIISNLIVFAFTSESGANNQPDQEEAMPVLEGVRVAFKNEPFRYITGIYLLAWCSIQFVQTLILFYYRDYVGGDPGLGFTLLLFTLQISIFIFILFWGNLSAKIGRKKVFMYGIPIWIVAQIGLFFVQPGQTTLVLVLAFIAGVGVALGFLIPWSLLPDAVDYDELETGKRREGVFYGLFVFLQKLGIAIALFVQGYVLDLAGYLRIENGVVPEQPESALFVMRVMIALVPILLLIVSMWLVNRYPITSEKLKEMQATLAQRREKDTLFSA